MRRPLVLLASLAAPVALLAAGCGDPETTSGSGDTSGTESPSDSTAVLTKPSVALPDELPAELVITDVRMPGLTGLEIVALLRQIDWALPVIVITGFGDCEVHAEVARLGAHVFDKPVDLDVLAAAACAAVGL